MTTAENSSEQIRRKLKALLDQRNLKMGPVSEMLDKNHAYLQQFINKGTPQKLPEDVRHRLAEILDVDESELTAQTARMGFTSHTKPALDNSATPLRGSGMIKLIELDVRAYAGGGGADFGQTAEVKNQWLMPKDVVHAQTTAGPDGLRIITVYGDSMEPTLPPGCRVLVDTGDRVPSPPGLFVVWDGLGLVIKRIELIAHSQPLTVRLSSDNPIYESYERTVDEAHISGRVIGRWAWT